MYYLSIVLAFGAGFLVVCGANLIFSDVARQNRRAARRRMEEELQARQKEEVRSTIPSDLYQAAAKELEEIEPPSGARERLRQFLYESGLLLRPDQLAAIVLMLGLVAALAAWAFLGLIAAILAGILAGAAPVLYVAFLRARRREKLRSQLPDAFELMGRTLRAGQTVSQALQAVAEEFSSPIAEEFAQCYDQQNLGLSSEAAMRDLARRTGLLELKIFVLAIVIHRQTGGNLTALLEKLAFIIRERYRIRSEIRTLTAEGRMQAAVLLALPVFMMGVLLTINRSYGLVLFETPMLLVGMFTFMALGALWLYKIVHFDF